jgi:hypothetical protein
LYVAYDLGNSLLLFEDLGGELGGRKMSDVFLGARILAVEVAAVGQQFGGGDFPSVLVFLALVPPRHARGEFLELDGRGLGVVLPAFRQRVFVIPDFARRAGAIKAL